MRRLLCLIVFGLFSYKAVADMNMEDDPLLVSLFMDEFEYRHNGDGDARVLDADLWLGKDLHKLWLKADYEKINGSSENIEMQYLYSRAISPYWDLQAGIKHDFGSEPDGHWFGLGVQGLAPYFFEVESSVYVEESGRLALQFESEYEMLITQKLIMTPEIELTVYSGPDRVANVGAGLAELEIGMRIRYELRREIAPYIGFSWFNTFGKTRDLYRLSGEPVEELHFVIGIQAWM